MSSSGRAPLTARERDSLYCRSKLEYSDALDVAAAVIEDDSGKYRAAYANHLLQAGESAGRDELDKLIAAVARKHSLVRADVPYVWRQAGVRLRQPDVPWAAVQDWKTADSTSKGEYVSGLFALFDRTVAVTDAGLREASQRAGAHFVTGPRKKSERLFEKARIAYGCDLQRVTDYERRSFICNTFAEMAQLVQSLPARLTILRMKNRFARANVTAKESGGYRDLQMVVRVLDGDVLLELQFHLKAFFELKSKVAASIDEGGQSGHERYIEFRGIKEQAEFNHRKAVGAYSTA